MNQCSNNRIMNIEEALQNINNYKEVSENILKKSFQIVIRSKLDNEQEIAEYLIEKYDLKNKNRSAEYIYKRMYLCWFLRDKHKFTYKCLGRMFSRDHSTIMNSVERHYDMEKFNFKFYYELTKELRDFLE